jgi:hypothetical protein
MEGIKAALPVQEQILVTASCAADTITVVYVK